MGIYTGEAPAIPLKVVRIEQLSRCPAAVLLAVEAHHTMLQRGTTDESSCGVAYDSKALVAYEGATPIGIITFKEVEWKNMLSLDFGYVKPEHRRKGVYRCMWTELCVYAREKGLSRIVGTTHRDNSTMQAVMEQFGRELQWLVYEYRLPLEDQCAAETSTLHNVQS